MYVCIWTLITFTVLDIFVINSLETVNQISGTGSTYMVLNVRLTCVHVYVDNGISVGWVKKYMLNSCNCICNTYIQ